MNFIWNKIPRPVQRRLANRFGRRLCRMENETPFISFAFDDFPRSALSNGGAILRSRGLAGTFYTSLGLMGQTTVAGQIFTRDDLNKLVWQGHELACHTFDHCDSWKTAPADFELSIFRNRQSLVRILPGTRFTDFSYPISWPRPETKRRVANYYQCARGGGQTFNSGIVDLNYLKGFFIEQCHDDFNAVQQIIDATTNANGWLIFVTHDVSASPSRFGCTPEFFERVVASAARSGAIILPVRAGFDEIFRRKTIFDEKDQAEADSFYGRSKIAGR